MTFMQSFFFLLLKTFLKAPLTFKIESFISVSVPAGPHASLQGVCPGAPHTLHITTFLSLLGAAHVEDIGVHLAICSVGPPLHL